MSAPCHQGVHVLFPMTRGEPMFVGREVMFAVEDRTRDDEMVVNAVEDRTRDDGMVVFAVDDRTRDAEMVVNAVDHRTRDAEMVVNAVDDRTRDDGMVVFAVDDRTRDDHDHPADDQFFVRVSCLRLTARLSTRFHTRPLEAHSQRSVDSPEPQVHGLPVSLDMRRHEPPADREIDIEEGDAEVDAHPLPEVDVRRRDGEP